MGAKSFSIEEKLELMGAQLEDATVLLKRLTESTKRSPENCESLKAIANEWSTSPKNSKLKSKTAKCRFLKPTKASKKWKPCAETTLRKKTTSITPSDPCPND